MTDYGIGIACKKLRKYLGISQLALAAEIDVSCDSIWKWERGYQNPTWAHVEKLETFFNEAFGLKPLPRAKISGEVVRKFRRHFRLRQKDLAAEIGAYAWQMVYWEKGRCKVPSRYAARLIAFFQEEMPRYKSRRAAETAEVEEILASPEPICGERLKTLRKYFKLTQEELAWGVRGHRITISDWERRMYRMSPEHSEKLRKFFNELYLRRQGNDKKAASAHAVQSA